MADVKKIKLPDNTIVNIKDYRIPGVDTAPTSGSDNVITSGGVYNDINKRSLTVSAALNDLNDRISDLESQEAPAVVWEAGTGENSVIVKGCEGTANGVYSTVEGYQSETGGTYTENTKTVTEDSSAGSYAHAEGVCTIASGAKGSHAEGRFTLASGGGAHAEGNRTISSGSASHAEGVRTISSGSGSHSEGALTEARGVYSHTEGQETITNAARSHTEGAYTITFDGVASHAEGIMTRANGTAAHSENGNWWINITSITGSANATSYSCTFNKNSSSHKIVDLYEWLGSTKFISLMKTAAIGKANYVQNTCTIAITNITNVSLSNNVLSCTFTLEKTLSETALSNASDYKITLVGAFGEYSHSENAGVSIGDYSHTDGESYAVGYQSHTEGSVTFALNDYEHAQGVYNKSTKTNSTFGNAGNTLHSVGIGSGCNDRKNAEEIMQNGDMYLIGVGDYDGTNFSEAQTVQQVINGINDIEEVASAALNDLNTRLSELESQPSVSELQAQVDENEEVTSASLNDLNTRVYYLENSSPASGLPAVTAADNGKILMVVNGAWALVSPSTIYSGSGTPNNSIGNNGDLYLQTD